MKKVAIMQPYIFPYIGYFQLIRAADLFVFYDDVNFIKQGWIARNRYLNSDKATYFVIPLQGISSFKKINEINVDEKKYGIWVKKFLKSLSQNYGKAPYFSAVIELVKEVLFTDQKSISRIAINSVKTVSDYLGLQVEFNISSEVYPTTMDLGRMERITKICELKRSKTYINAIGGTGLYQKDEFKQRGIDLHFLQTDKLEYEQFKKPFVPGLSIIDVMMFNHPEEIKKMLDKYKLI